MELNGKTAIVTGGARGLGLCIARKLRSAGAVVCVMDCNEGRLNGLAVSDPGLIGMVCDVTDHGSVVSAVSAFQESHGVPDLLVNNAGILYSAPLLAVGPQGLVEHSLIEWRRVLAINLDGVFHMTMAVAGRMMRARKRGVIINISSVAAAGNAGQSAYSAAKAGVNALTATWAKELGGLGIRVAGIAPGFIDTDSTREAMSGPGLQEVVKQMPLRRLGRVEEVADAVLAVITNDFIHGKTIPVDGGLIL